MHSETFTLHFSIKSSFNFNKWKFWNFPILSQRDRGNYIIQTAKCFFVKCFVTEAGSQQFCFAMRIRKRVILLSHTLELWRDFIACYWKAHIHKGVQSNLKYTFFNLALINQLITNSMLIGEFCACVITLRSIGPLRSNRWN